MPIIKQHMPNFASIDPQEAEFETLEDLMNVEFVKRWTDNRWGDDFHQFSISHDDWMMRLGHEDYIHLMAELDGGKKWYVVGYIYGLSPEEIGLPKWKMVKGGE